MEPVERVFAREFSTARYTVDAGDGHLPVTPSGACSHRLFIVGALTERLGGGDLMQARVADPTGVFLVTVDWHNPDALETLGYIDPPVFVAVTARPVPGGSGDRACPALEVEAIRVVDRTARDIWVLATAAATLDRLEALRDGRGERAATALRLYATTENEIREMAGIVRTALATVREVPSPSRITPRAPAEILLDALKAVDSGLKGISIEDAVAAGVGSGLTASEARTALEKLLAAGECYQPVDGTVKLI